MANDVNIPSALIETIKSRRCLLFLGSGASRNAKTSIGSLPVSEQLAKLLADKFLGGKHRNKALSMVADLCQGAVGRHDVEMYLVELFGPAIPTSAHILLPEFSWKAIFTTNYDCLVEKAYKSSSKLHYLHISASDANLEDAVPESPGHLELLKLHGCVDGAPDSDSPLILTIAQYARYTKNRARLFARFEMYAGDFQMLFIGHSLQDPDIEYHLNEDYEARPHGYLVSPDIDEFIQNSLTKKNITGIAATFDQFMTALSASISKTDRALGQYSLTSSHAIEKKFASSHTIDITISAHLESAYVYLDPEFKPEHGVSRDFFLGQLNPFTAVNQGVVIKRKPFDDLVIQLLLDADRQSDSFVSSTLVTGPAGSGKTVLLAHLATHLGVIENKPVLFLKPGHPLKPSEIARTAAQLAEPLYLFIDNAADWGEQLTGLFKEVLQLNTKLIVVAAERLNESNARDLEVVLRAPRRSHLNVLTRGEAKQLVAVLESADCLGRMALLPEEDRIRSLTEAYGAGGDLLVSIYSSTHNESLEEHLVDEFNSIPNELARQMYLTICCIHRLKVFVRAGALARIHKVGFEEFSETFYSPLEKIVEIVPDGQGDYFYRTRHQVVAQIVYERILADEANRLHVMLRALAGLLSGYSSDESALRGLMSNESLIANFPTSDYARQFIDGYLRAIGHDAYANHQAAVYELRAHAGDLQRAERFITTALELAPEDKRVQHSYAYLLYRKSKIESEQTMRSHLLREAEHRASQLKGHWSPYPYHTLALIFIDRLKEELSKGQGARRDVIDSYVEAAQLNLAEGLALFPHDARLMEAEAGLADTLGHSKEAENLLRAVLKFNPGRVGVALAISRAARAREDFMEARGVLEAAYERQSNHALLKLELAEAIIRDEGVIPADYKRARALVDSAKIGSISPLRAKLIKARALFSDGEGVLARQELMRIRHEDRTRGRNWKLLPTFEHYTGRVTSYDPFAGAWVETTKFGRVFARVQDMPKDLHTSVFTGRMIEFRIAMSSSGPVAIDVTVVLDDGPSLADIHEH